MSAQEKLRRQVSCLFERGVDPYNTADSIRVSAELSADFVTWAGDGPQQLPAGDGHLRTTQAE